jgi:hypothetical protein
MELMPKDKLRESQGAVPKELQEEADSGEIEEMKYVEYLARGSDGHSFSHSITAIAAQKGSVLGQEAKLTLMQREKDDYPSTMTELTKGGLEEQSERQNSEETFDAHEESQSPAQSDDCGPDTPCGGE